MAIDGGGVAAGEFNAVDVELVGRNGGVDGFVWIERDLAGEWCASEALPGEGEVEHHVVFVGGEPFPDRSVLYGELVIDEGCGDGGEAGFAPTGVGEFFDEVVLGVVGGAIAVAVAGEVFVPGVGVVGADEDEVFGGEAVFE